MIHFKEFILHCVLPCTFYFGSSTGLTIAGDQLSPVVRMNGTQQPLVLDCDYGYEQHETAGLTVKWFWDKDLEPVYQWIPGGVPEVRGILKGRVNVSYLAAPDRYSAHRALQILKPTSDLSGTFTCTVSSFFDEKKYKVKVLIYSKASSLDLKFHKPSPTNVNVTCSAEGLYPKPKMTLYARTQHQRFQIKNININTFQHFPSTGSQTGTWAEEAVWEVWGDTINKKKSRNTERNSSIRHQTFHNSQETLRRKRNNDIQNVQHKFVKKSEPSHETADKMDQEWFIRKKRMPGYSRLNTGSGTNSHDESPSYTLTSTVPKQRDTRYGNFQYNDRATTRSSQFSTSQWTEKFKGINYHDGTSTNHHSNEEIHSQWGKNERGQHFQEEQGQESEEDKTGGWYSISADVVLDDDTLHEEGQLLECEVMLPGTSYVDRTNVVYFPGYDAMELYAQESTSQSSSLLSQDLHFVSLFLLLVTRWC